MKESYLKYRPQKILSDHLGQVDFPDEQVAPGNSAADQIIKK